MEVVTKIAPIALALIMLALGLGLTGQDFLRVVKQPKDFLVGLICQLILLPIIAFLLLKIFNLPLEIALGVMIIAAAPGGVTSKKAMGLPIIFKTINLCILLDPLISVRRSPAPWNFNQ